MKVLRVLAVLLSLTGSLAFTATPGAAQVSVGVGVHIGPPAPRYEVVPASPGPRYFWRAGFWAWNGSAYVWRPGAYVVRPAWATGGWVPGHWVQRPAGWFWVRGHWAA